MYDQYAPALLGQITNIVGNLAISEEVLQQTMLKVWNGIDSYDESKAGLFAWMSKIARNTAIDKRRLNSFQRNQKPESLQSHVNKVEDPPTSASKLDVEYLTKSLDEKYKVVLDHVYLKGFTQAETAELLDIPLGTIKTRLRSALLILRESTKGEKTLFLGLFALLLFLALLIWT